jgi:hypothetical protein
MDLGSDDEEESAVITKQDSELQFAEPLGEIDQEQSFEQNLKKGRHSRVNTEMQFQTNLDSGSDKKRVDTIMKHIPIQVDDLSSQGGSTVMGKGEATGTFDDMSS